MSTAFDSKIVSRAVLTTTLQTARADGRTVVQCHGCFDLVHPGHVRYLRFARQLGDILVVSLTADAGVTKGLDRPYIPAELRAENLAALEFVDWVVIDDHPTAVEILQQLKPDVYVKGREYAVSSDPRFLKERETVEGYGGRVVFHSGDVIFSSTRLIETLESDEQLDEMRLRTLCRRAEIDRYKLHATLDGLRGLPVLVIGDVLRERYVLCDAAETATDAPVLALQRLGVREYWGGAAALALQLQALGAKPYLIASVGSDLSTQQLADDLAAAGVGAQLLPARPALVERNIFVADDARLFQLNDGVCCPLDTAWEKCAAATVLAQLAEARLVLWADHGLGTVTNGLIRRATAACLRADVPIAGHAGGTRGNLELLQHAVLLAMTERQLRATAHDLSSSLPAVVSGLLDQTKSRAALVSLPKRGWLAFDAGDARPQTERGGRLESHFVPALSQNQRDPLGSDEATLALAAAVIANGGGLPEATYLAALIEALAVRKPGRTCVKLSELRTAIDQRPELRGESHFIPDSLPIGDLASIAPPLQSINAERSGFKSLETIGSGEVRTPITIGAV